MSVSSFVPSSLNTPTLPSNPTSADGLQFEAGMQMFQIKLDQAKNEIQTIGDAIAGAVSVKPQPS